MLESTLTSKLNPLFRAWCCVPLVAALALGIGCFAAPSAVDPQTWTHIELGETILQRGELPISTQVAAGYCWMNDCWLTQVIMALVMRSAGIEGLSTLACLIGIISIGCMIYFNRRDQVGWAVTFGGATLVAVALLQSWQVGPQIASIAWFTVLIALLHVAFEGWRGQCHWTSVRRWTRSDWVFGDDQLKYDSRRLRLLWIAVPLFCVWSNMDGAFQIGLFFFLTYIAIRALEAIWQRGRLGFGLARRMLLMGAVASLATLLNPYGPWLHGWLLTPETLSQREALHGPSLSIVETNSGFIFLLIVALVLASIAFNRRQNDLSQIAALVVLGAFTIFDANCIALFAIASGYWAVPGLNALFRTFSANVLKHSNRFLHPSTASNQSNNCLCHHNFSDPGRVFAVLAKKR